MQYDTPKLKLQKYSEDLATSGNIVCCHCGGIDH